MKKSRLTSSFLLLFLTGCSSIDSGWNNTVDFILGPDDGTDTRETAVAENVANIAGSEDPQTTAISTAVNVAANNAAQVIDSSITNSHTEISVTGFDKGTPRYDILNVTGLWSAHNGHSQTFMQSSVNSANARTTLNAGLGQRYLSKDENFISGINAFFDYNPDYGHQRASVGVELKSSAIEFTGNSYHGLTGWRTGKNSASEKALDGYDLELGVQMPYVPGAKLYAKRFKWEMIDVADIEGNTYSLGYSHLFGSGISIEMGRKDYDGSTTDVNFAQVSYKIPLGKQVKNDSKPIFSNNMFESRSMKNNMLDKVRRNNAIVVQTKFVAAVGGV
jgi:hypothetical protein